MHILIISTAYPSFYQPLQGRFYYDQALGLKKAGNEVGFIGIIPVSIKDFINKGWRHHGHFENEDKGIHSSGRLYVQLPKYFSYQFSKTLRSGKKYFSKYIENFGKPDIVHLHGFEGGNLPIWIKENYNIPFVCTEHSSRFLTGALTEKQLNFAKKIYNAASARIAVSDSFALVLNQQTGLLFEVIPNITDTDMFHPGNKNEKYILLSAATFNKNKNQRLMIDSFLSIIEKMPDSELWLVGGGPEKIHLDEYVHQKSAENRIKFLGFKMKEELAAIIRQASLFLIASDHESFGVVAIEAMSCGLPVLSTPCGGPESIIKDSSYGEIALANPVEYSKKMLSMYNERDNYDHVRIRKYAVDNFSMPAVSKKLCNVYSRYIKSGQN